jgi:hypothetical protein
MTDVTLIDLTSQNTAVEASGWLDAIIEKDCELARGFVRWMLRSPENVRVLLRIGQLFVIGEDNGLFLKGYQSRLNRRKMIKRTRALIEENPELFSADHLPKDEESLRKIAELVKCHLQ